MESEANEPFGASAAAADERQLRRWFDHLFAEPSELPISFGYEGATVRGVPATWSPTTTFRRFGSTIVQHVHEGRDPQSGLGIRVEVERYLDFPVVEWTAWMTNHSGDATGRVRDLKALDTSFAGAGGSVYHCNGDFNSNDGYTWVTTPLEGRDDLHIAPNGGRPCDGAFPYARLLFDGGGLTLAIGWPGQWSVSFADAGGAVAVRAGQQRTDMRLLPGETVRTPRITAMSWAGDQERAANLWRRWYREHVMPRRGGKPVAPLLSVSGTDEGVEFTAATEANQIEYQNRFAAENVDFDVWWIDAGWYPCRDEHGTRDWVITGTWRPDPERFPRGLAPVGEAAASHGAALLLWYEPERVFPGTELATKRREWLLERPRGDEDASQKRRHLLSALLDLANPACREWLTDHVSQQISDYRLGIYRQDFNFPPAEYWRANDAEDRQGITENLYVQGYLRFWDDLLERHPGLLIDSCASGGRRNDLETMRRSVPLHYTDYGYGRHPTKLDFHRTMFEWIPYFKESSLSWDLDEAAQAGIEAREGDSFAFHCALAPMLAPAVDVKRSDNDFDTVRKMVSIWRTVADLLLDGDYYPLTGPGRTGKEWVVWQFHRAGGRPGGPGTVGFVQAIRLAGAEEGRLTVRLRALRPEAVYVLEEAETRERRAVRGGALVNDGLELELPRRSGSIWSYREKGA